MKPEPIFCEACKDTGWLCVNWPHKEGSPHPCMPMRCPHCDTGEK